MALSVRGPLVPATTVSVALLLATVPAWSATAAAYHEMPVIFAGTSEGPTSLAISLRLDGLQEFRAELAGFDLRGTWQVGMVGVTSDGQTHGLTLVSNPARKGATTSVQLPGENGIVLLQAAEATDARPPVVGVVVLRLGDAWDDHRERLVLWVDGAALVEWEVRASGIVSEPIVGHDIRTLSSLEFDDGVMLGAYPGLGPPGDGAMIAAGLQTRASVSRGLNGILGVIPSGACARSISDDSYTCTTGVRQGTLWSHPVPLLGSYVDVAALGLLPLIGKPAGTYDFGAIHAASARLWPDRCYLPIEDCASHRGSPDLYLTLVDTEVPSFPEP